MSAFQRVIKYLAIAFAIVLAVGIISGICFGIGSVFGFISHDSDGEIEKEFSLSKAESALYIDLSGAALTFKTGSDLEAVSDSKYIKCRQDGSRLLITQTGLTLIGKNKKDISVTVYVPEDMIFDEIDIDMGAGTLTADVLNAKGLTVDMGAGEAIIDELNVSEEAEIDGGAGSITVLKGNIANLDADTGAGDFDISARLSGTSSIDHGIGEANICLTGSEDDYTIELEKGIGEATLNGFEVSDGTYGNGPARLEVDCGIGEINIDFLRSN